MRSRTSAAALAGALLALGCSEKAAPPPAPAVQVPAAPPVAAAPALDAGVQVEHDGTAASVVGITAGADVKRQGSEEWVALSLGDAVRVGDQVRTPAGGGVELSFDVARVRVSEDSQLELTMLTAREVRANLSGAGEAELPEGQQELAFGVGAAVASARAGRMALHFDGKTATASAIEGTANFTLGDKTVALRPGEFASVRGQSLSRAAKLPAAVKLDVAWPQRSETNKSEVSFKGRASPFARVLVAGRRVEAAADGSFEAKVPLKRGKQTVTVVAVDPAGRRVTKSKQFVMDPDAPSIKGRVEYDR